MMSGKTTKRKLMRRIIIIVSYFSQPTSCFDTQKVSSPERLTYITDDFQIQCFSLFTCGVACSCRSRVSRPARFEARLDGLPRWRRSAGCQRHVQCRLSLPRQRRSRRVVSNRHVYRLLLERTTSQMPALVYNLCTTLFDVTFTSLLPSPCTCNHATISLMKLFFML